MHRFISILAALTLVLAVRASASDTEAVLYAFGGIPNDAAAPAAGLIVDKLGNFYGTTQAGGASGCVHCFGAAYELSLVGGTWKETILHSFGGSDGYEPLAPLAPDGAGDLFGTTFLGGDTYGSGCSTNGCGEVFELTHGMSGWTESNVYSFTDGSDGAYPTTAVTFDGSGDLFGTASGGGSAACTGGCGVAFKLTPSSGKWTESVIHTFTGAADGAKPYASVLIMGPKIFGTALYGGNTGAPCPPGGCGVVFELAKSGGVWNETVIHTFTGGADGDNPISALTADRAGNLYGTAAGGTHSSGLIYKLTRGKTGWTEHVLYNLTGHPAIGPLGDLSMDSNGDLFGAASGGNDCTINRSRATCGVVYELVHGAGNSWTEKVLYSFLKTVGGWNPNGHLLIDSSSDVFGTTVKGAESNGCCGDVFELKP